MKEEQKEEEEAEVENNDDDEDKNNDEDGEDIKMLFPCVFSEPKNTIPSSHSLDDKTSFFSFSEKREIIVLIRRKKKMKNC